MRGVWGSTLAALVLVFTGLGYVVDRWLRATPWLIVAGVFVGASLGFAYLVPIVTAGSSSGRSERKREDRSGGPGEGTM